MGDRLIDQAIAILPDVADGFQWTVTTETAPKGGETASFELLDPAGQPCGRGLPVRLAERHQTDSGTRYRHREESRSDMSDWESEINRFHDAPNVRCVIFEAVGAGFMTGDAVPNGEEAEAIARDAVDRIAEILGLPGWQGSKMFGRYQIGEGIGEQ